MLCYPQCAQLSTTLNDIVVAELGVTILLNVVDNYKQYGQHNIIQYCTIYNDCEQLDAL